MHPETSSQRLLVLIEPPLVLGLAFLVSMFFGSLGLVGTALLVESDPFGSLLGSQRKLQIELTPKETEILPAIDQTRSIVSSAFETADVIVVPNGENSWRLLAWIEDDPGGESLAGIAVELDALGWSDPVPGMSTQQRFAGVMENPRRMRVYIPVFMTIQVIAFILAAWGMLRWRKPAAFGTPVATSSALVWGAGAALVAFLGSVSVGAAIQFAGLEIEEQAWIQSLMADRPSLLLMLPWLVLAGPASEEVFFRGYVFRRVYSGFGPLAGYLASALLFAIIHLHPVGFPMYTIIGLVFCWVYQRTGSLWAPVFGHVFYNALVVTLPLLAVPST
jgi:membrane protease YdiL (CAAX protease family)